MDVSRHTKKNLHEPFALYGSLSQIAPDCSRCRSSRAYTKSSSKERTYVSLLYATATFPALAPALARDDLHSGACTGRPDPEADLCGTSPNWPTFPFWGTDQPFLDRLSGTTWRPWVTCASAGTLQLLHASLLTSLATTPPSQRGSYSTWLTALSRAVPGVTV